MRRYLIRYLIFWLPAALVATLFANQSVLSQALQWFFAFFMVFAWTVNTAGFSYRYPRRALSLLLLYAGLTLLLIVVGFNSYYGSNTYVFSKLVGGIFCARPLGIMVETLKEFDWPMPREYYVLGFVMVCLGGGYAAGLVRRRIHPDPYRPRVAR